MKMFHKRDWTACCLGIMGIAMLAGCGGKSEESSTPPPSATSRATGSEATVPADATAPQADTPKSAEGRKSLPLAPGK